MSHKPRTVQAGLAAAIAACALVFASCGGSSGFFDGISRVVGQALRPVGNLIDQNPVPLGDAVVTLVDFADETVGRVARTMEVGTTDANGNYEVNVEGQPIAAIVINGTNDQGQAVRVSGLVVPDEEDVMKNFDPVTDIACEAGLSALLDGSVAPDDFDEDRVTNLEDASRQFVAANPGLDYLNPADVSAAAQMVRAATNAGADEAPEGAFGEMTPEPEPTAEPEEMTETDLECANGVFTCSDGTQICNEFVCNSGSDCPDGSDEDFELCGEQGSCCVATNGCPTETGTSCGETCCCCGLNEICDRDNLANGCIGTANRGTPDPENPLSKLFNFRAYY